MHLARKVLGQPVQMMLMPAALPQPIILSPNQNRELESALAQLLLSAFQPSPQPTSKGGGDVDEDHA